MAIPRALLLVRHAERSGLPTGGRQGDRARGARGEPGDETALPQPGRGQRPAGRARAARAAAGDRGGDPPLPRRRDYLERIKALSAENGGDAGELTPFGPGGYEIALLAAGGVITAIDAVLDGTVDNVYALTRPPGHHAEPDRGRGFCIFANAAIGAKHAREARGLDRVAVVDWDVHHGNGTQKIFWEDPSVLTISSHQDNNYPPDSGHVHEVGAGAGEGFNLNVPLPAGSGVGAYVAAYERVVAPALRAFRPDLIIVASGLDASNMDPLARMMMHSDGYRQLTRLLMDVAEDVCEGRLVVEHEGGYSSAYVPFCGLASSRSSRASKSAIDDPYLEFFQGVGRPGPAAAPGRGDRGRRGEPVAARAGVVPEACARGSGWSSTRSPGSAAATR